jgi:hypothetical protein
MKFKLDECVDARLSLIERVKREKPEGRLWIVELERIRIHESIEE